MRKFRWKWHSQLLQQPRNGVYNTQNVVICFVNALISWITVHSSIHSGAIHAYSEWQQPIWRSQNKVGGGLEKKAAARDKRNTMSKRWKSCIQNFCSISVDAFYIRFEHVCHSNSNSSIIETRMAKEKLEMYQENMENSLGLNWTLGERVIICYCSDSDSQLTRCGCCCLLFAQSLLTRHRMCSVVRGTLSFAHCVYVFCV